MKKLAIITAMLILTLSLSAQNNNTRRSRSSRVETKEKKSTPRTAPSRSRSYEAPSKKSNSSAVKPHSSSGNRKATRTQPSSTSNRSSATRSRSNPSPAQRSNPDVKRNSNSRSDSYNRGNERSRSNSSYSGNSRTRTPAADSRHPSNRREATTTRTYNSGSRKANTGTTYKRGNHYDPKTGQQYTRERRVYKTPAPRRIVRPAPKVKYAQRPVEYRRKHSPYVAPPRVDIVWTSHMHREYVYLYPEFKLWYYPYGYHIRTISAYDAYSYVGEVTRIYGRVYETWYSRETDEYYLYFGGPYPYHDFSIVLEGRDARRFSRRPERYFDNRYLAVTGLVSLWEGKPEIVVKKRRQIDLY